MSLTRNISMYHFIIRPHVTAFGKERVLSVFSENLEKAVAKAHQINPSQSIAYTGQKVPVEEIIKIIQSKMGEALTSPEIKPEVEPEVKTERPEIPVPVLKKNQFKSGLMLACDKFVKLPKDKKVIKNIINKI